MSRYLPGCLTAQLFLITVLACDWTATPTSPLEPLPPSGNGFSSANPAFLTPLAPLARPLVPGAEVTALLSVGDLLPGSSVAWAPKPDGLGAFLEDGQLTVLVNHELSSDGIPLESGGWGMRNARLSRLRLSLAEPGILSGHYLLDGTEGYEKLCSGTWVDGDSGFPSGFFLSGEEVKEGLQLAVGRDGRIVELPWIGRWAHENLVAVPGFPGRIVLVGLDDSKGASELYMYVGADEADVILGRGTLYVFVSETAPTPADLAVGLVNRGRWVEVANAAQMSGEDLQELVEELGAFPFVRLEDGTPDRRKGLARPALYFADTGSPDVPDSSTPWDPYGSLYRMEFDPTDPTRDSRLILLARSAGSFSGWASPDNMESDESSVLLQEDPAYDGFGRGGRIYRFPIEPDGYLGAGVPLVELEDPDCPAGGACWESSGIIDVSRWYGDGAWLFDIMAGTLPVPSLGLTAGGGQLLLLRLSGS